MIFWLLAAAVVAYFFYSTYSQTRKLPPGPSPLPLVGNIHQLFYGFFKHRSVITVWKEWRKTYGDVFTFWLGPLPTVNICDYQLAQEAMVKNGSNFVDRLYIYIVNVVRENMGVIMSNGGHWQEQRRFALHTLRNFGLGKNVMQDRIMLEYDYRSNILDKDIEKAGGQLNMDPYHFLELTVGNVINRILFTERFVEDEEKEFFRLKKIIDNLIEQSSIIDFALTERSAQWPGLKQYKDYRIKPLWDIVDFIKGQVTRRKAEIASGERDIHGGAEDYVDAFFLEMEKSDKGDSFTEHSLVITLFDLWLAGQETTTTTLQWAIAYLIQNPHDLKKLQEELDQVTGRSRSLNLSDKPNTPFLNAVILEVLRVSSLLPMNLWRIAAADTAVGGYAIPKGTPITAQLSVIMNDESNFKDPQKFNPSRFLENNNDQYVVAFGLGKRACLGESLARAELYMILGNLALHYNFVEDPKRPASMKALTERSSVRKARAYNILISKRT